MPERFSDQFLQAKRGEGDPRADFVIHALAESHKLESVSDLFQVLVANEQPPPAALPPIARDYFNQTTLFPPWAERAKILRGQQFFMRNAHLAIPILFCRSLPLTYLARKGVQVIARTARLANDPRRRTLETAQFVVDVMSPGGLDAHGAGVRTAQKVRLMHAALRHLLLATSWDVQDLGLPINQEDLAGTLMAFSVSVVEGIELFGADVSGDERECYFHAWRVIGTLMGIDESLIPSDYAEGFRLIRAIETRHYGPSEEAQYLTEALIAMLKEAVPGTLMDGLPASLVREMIGDPWADVLGVPPADATERLVRLVRALFGGFDEATDRSRLLRRLAGAFGEALIRGLVALERGPKRVTFRIPTELRQAATRRPPSLFFRAIARVADAIPQPRVVTRRFALGAPYGWLQFATRFKDDDGVVGESFFHEFADRMGAGFWGRGTDTGLMENFEDLRSDEFEPFSVADVIRRFYEQTTRFDLELDVKWNPLFVPVGLAYREWIARRVRNFDIPFGAVEDLKNWIELIDVDRDGDVDVRAWVRVHGNERNPMWVGAYKIYRSAIDGPERSYITVAFPLPGGNLTTVLAPKNFEGNGLLLVSDDPTSSEAGLYQIVPRRDTFSMLPAFGLHERFELRPTREGEEIEVVHTSTWFGLPMFTMRYEIRPKRVRDPRRVLEFGTAVRAGRGKAAGA